MRVTDIRIESLRTLTGVEFRPSPAMNLVTGRNGAGKTSLIEALHLLAHGRSFRTGQIDSLIRHGAGGFTTFVHVRDARGRERTLGMNRHARGWLLKTNGAPVATLIDFVRYLAIVTLEPETHQLVTGTAEGRRRYLDWLLFHVEPDFLGCWRRYLRALRQRNAALRSPGTDLAMVRIWESELAVSGEQIDTFRRKLFDALYLLLEPLSRRLLSGSVLSGMLYRQGWPEGLTLVEAYAQSRTSDRERGFTQRGPHRSDWRLEFENGVTQAQLSRGQAKLVAIACLLAQALHFRSGTGEWPIFACDDMASELDAEHQDELLAWLAETGGQVFITGTEESVAWQRHLSGDTKRFHVEHGRITPG